MNGTTHSDQLSHLSQTELLDLARTYTWVHTIELSDNYTTEGLWGRGIPEIWEAFDAIDFTGKKVLDIGCWDGQWTFEAEARGAAEVWATDLTSQRDFSDQYTFEVAAALKGSGARYMPNLSVYDVGFIGTKFDVVLYMGIFYHLKDPLQAFAVLRQNVHEGGQIVVEGAVLDDPGCFANFYYREPFAGDNSNWWVPTRDCLRQWVECSFFDIQWQGERHGRGGNERHCLVGRAVRRPDPFYIRVPEGLEQFHK